MAARKQDLPVSVGCPLVLAMLAICGYLLWTLISTIAADWRSAPPPVRSQTEEVPKEKAIAALINLNGELCAKVELIAPTTDPDEFSVYCQEYSDPRKSGTKKNIAVYMVNMSSGTARLLART